MCSLQFALLMRANEQYSFIHQVRLEEFNLSIRSIQLCVMPSCWNSLFLCWEDWQCAPGQFHSFL